MNLMLLVGLLSDLTHLPRHACLRVHAHGHAGANERVHVRLGLNATNRIVSWRLLHHVGGKRHSHMSSRCRIGGGIELGRVLTLTHAHRTPLLLLHAWLHCVPRRSTCRAATEHAHRRICGHVLWHTKRTGTKTLLRQMSRILHEGRV